MHPESFSSFLQASRHISQPSCSQVGGRWNYGQRNAGGSWCVPRSGVAYYKPPCKILHAPFPFLIGGMLMMVASQMGQVWAPERLCGGENCFLTTFFISWHRVFEETRAAVPCPTFGIYLNVSSCCSLTSSSILCISCQLKVSSTAWLDSG